jgi:diguanylate cyclase (GGDEF)-like protein
MAADVVSHCGGEEFVVFIPRTALDSAIAVAERLRAELAAARIEPLPGPVTVSVGLTELPAAELGEPLPRYADKALYEARKLGRNRVILG